MTSKEETAVLVTTFPATLLLLELAVTWCALLVLYLSRTSHPQIVDLAPDLNLTCLFSLSEANVPISNSFGSTARFLAKSRGRICTT
jgi:hypothetical protein